MVSLPSAGVDVVVLVDAADSLGSAAVKALVKLKDFHHTNNPLNLFTKMLETVHLICSPSFTQCLTEMHKCPAALVTET